MPMLSRLSTLEHIAACNDADALLEHLRACASDILSNLARMAAILRRLDELGVKVEIDHALLPYIRMIANGSLLAECFVACSGDPLLLESAVRLPTKVQKQIADNKPFKVLNADGSARMVPPLELGRRELTQVFKGGHVRTEEEQREWLVSSANKSTALKRRMAGPEKTPFVDPNYPNGREHLSEPDAGPRMPHSVMAVDLNWEAKKVVSAAIRWRNSLKSADQIRDLQEANTLLSEAVDDYIENTQDGAAA